MSSVTVAPALLRTLAETQGDSAEAWRESLFFKKEDPGNTEGARSGGSGGVRQTFLNDEKGYRAAFASRDAGKGETKTKQVSFLGFFLWGGSALRRCSALD